MLVVTFRRALKLRLVEMGHDATVDKGQRSIDKLLDRCFHLREEDELLVQSILNRDPDLEGVNPYDPYLSLHVVAGGASVTGETSTSMLEQLDTKLMDLAMDHDWNDCNSMMDTLALGSQTARKCIPEVAQSVKRLSTSSQGSIGACGSGAQRCFGTTLSVISEDGQCHNSNYGTLSNRAVSYTESTCPEPLSHRRWKAGSDYLTEMREERDLERLYDPHYSASDALSQLRCFESITCSYHG